MTFPRTKEKTPGEPVLLDRPTFVVWTVLVTFVLIVMGPCTSAFAKKPHQEFPVGPPPLSPGIFPCSSCHEGMEANTEKRTLTEHTDIKFRHAPEALSWCLSCHDAKDLGQAPACEWGDDRLHGIVSPVRAMPRDELPGLEGGHPWQEGGLFRQWAETVFSVRQLS